MCFPKVCNICANAKINADLFRGNIELDLEPFVGTKLSVMLVGQDPTVARRQIYTVLDLKNPSGRLYKYIVKEILEPTGLKLNDIYATDLVKCRFSYNQTPNAISKNHHITIKDFLHPFFHNCRQHFLQEVQQIHPKIVLSFGQPVHQLLIEEFGWTVPIKMKDAFSKTYEVNLLGDNALYAPCIHVNTKGMTYYKNLWPNFIQSLKETVISVGIT